MSSSSSSSSSLSVGSSDRYKREKHDKRRRRDSSDSDSYNRQRSHKKRDRSSHREKDSMASHPYFLKKDKTKAAKKYDDNGVELFWDGFQWVPQQTKQSFFNPMQEMFI